MDNITHTLAGIAVAEAALLARRGAPGSRQRVKRLFWGASIAANNLPDLDFLIAPITQGKVGYLLHHRGYTHTFLTAIPQGLLILAAILCLARFRSWKLRASDWKWLAGISIIGGILHIAMDGMNNYGIHPFWPWANGWHYGDFMFIVEPWLWTCLVPPFLFAERNRRWRIFLALPFFGGMAVCWAAPIVPWYCALMVTATGLALWYGIAKLDPAGRLAAGIGSALAVTGVFAFVSLHNRHFVEARQRETGKGFALEDVVLSPLPSNPFCWTLLTVESKNDVYRVRKGMLASFPGWVTAKSCPVFRVGRGIAPLEEVFDPPDEHLWWFGEYTASLGELRELGGKHCGIAALFRFARAPFIVRKPDGYLAGDLRYDFSRGLSFAESPFPFTMPECPQNVPPWNPPKEKMLKAP